MSEKIKQAFIIGTGRCGTTWLGQMLNSNPALCVPPEIQLLFEYSGNGNRLYEEYLLAREQGLDSDQLISIIERGCPHNLDQFFDYPTFCREDATPKTSLREFVSAFYSAVAQSHGKRWLIEQTPWYGQRLDLVTALFPDAKFIHVVRDGRDVALSFARTTWWHRSARLNLSRWQREIKKIALDAAFFLKPEAYLEVRYEDLVADTSAELKKICEFLGVDFDPAMLDPQGFIDYDHFCKFDLGQVSSQAYSAWRKQKSKTVFADNVEAWRKNEGAFDKSLPPEIACWLSRYGYTVEAPDATDTQSCHLREYSLNALEQENMEKVQHIQKLEQSVADYVKYLGEARLVEQDWVARGELLEQLAGTIHALEQDNTARGETLEHLGFTIRALEHDKAECLEKIHALEQALARQAEEAALVKDESQARSELIDQLGQQYQALEKIRGAQDLELNELRQTIDELKRDIDTRTQQMAGVEQTLAAYAQQTVLSEQELAARAQQSVVFEQELVAHAQQALVFEQELAARAEQTVVFEQELVAHAQRALEFEQELAAHTEQAALLGQALQARELLLEQAAEANETLKKESADRHEHIIVLERALAEHRQQSDVAEQHLSTRERLIEQLTASVDALNATNHQQAEKIEQLMADGVVSADTNSQLVQEIADQKRLIEDLEGRLNEFERSWYGILRKRFTK